MLSLVEMFTSSAGNWENSVEFSFVDMSELPYLTVHFNLQQACVDHSVNINTVLLVYLKLLLVHSDQKWMFVYSSIESS